MTITKTKRFSTIGACALIGAGAALMGAAGTEAQSKAQSKAEVGKQAPDFTLTALDGSEHTLSDYTDSGNIVVLEWFNPSCPFVRKHYRDDTMTMVNMEKELEGDDVVWLRINSGHKNHPTADHDFNKKAADGWNISSPLLMDHSGDVGRDYGAKRTPEMYVIDDDGVLRYHGAIDNRSDAAAPGDTNHVQKALKEVMAGQTVTTPTTRAYGCSVKYN